MGYYYNDANAITIKEKTKEMAEYNEIVNNMDAELVYQVSFSAFEPYASAPNDKDKFSMLLNFYRVTDKNVAKRKDIIKIDDTEGASIPAGLEAQVSYAATFTNYIPRNGEEVNEPWKYYHKNKNCYHSVSDPREVIVARNYPSPYSDYAKILLQQQLKPFISKAQALGDNGALANFASLADVSKVITDFATYWYFEEKKKKTIAEVEAEKVNKVAGQLANSELNQ